ncbi:TetR/AcrR family transcriptional regulator [Fischerella thermalis CCMEE 5273]|uniref:HTH tetR-type domain-containing protein n=1 Tax=Chlorogloeopsis fritschii PCC 6912 TaxID=211165 RepID=A0A433NLC8_CHLFR|nr:TetR/AcrR family transcriptional regulator [Chlorogloeopsis fritschii]PMB09477.1 TetR/AcrR family transcriptional regulator [Fischerella thermalis CCMEE 5273]RUR83734.1 hypothetical protein PCC6912_19770 [Chlorogloeopsis fritschii PCC 6912]
MNQNRRRKIITNPRKLPQQERSKITVDAILTATARILVKDGYAKTNTNRIAELAGVSIGSLYQYFPSKEAIIAALIECHVVEMVNSIKTKTKLCLDKSLEYGLHEQACLI